MSRVGLDDLDVCEFALVGERAGLGDAGGVEVQADDIAVLPTRSANRSRAPPGPQPRSIALEAGFRPVESSSVLV